MSYTSVRSHEKRRPVFWNNRPNSYQFRTRLWDVDHLQQGFGAPFEPVPNHYLCNCYVPDCAGFEPRSIWGAELQSLEDVASVFRRYVSNEDVPALPWIPHLSHTSRYVVPKHMEQEMLHMIDRGLYPTNWQVDLSETFPAHLDFSVLLYFHHHFFFPLLDWIILDIFFAFPHPLIDVVIFFFF